jgi:hypothetical protein
MKIRQTNNTQVKARQILACKWMKLNGRIQMKWAGLSTTATRHPLAA